MYNFGKCSEELNNPIIVLKERGKNFRLLNKERIKCLKVDIDGCLNFEGKKCDYLVVVLKEHNGIYVELKGKKISHAYKQLKNSIRAIEFCSSEFLNRSFNKRDCYIIANRSPQSSTEIQRQALIFKRDFNSTLTIRKSGYEIEI